MRLVPMSKSQTNQNSCNYFFDRDLEAVVLLPPLRNIAAGLDVRDQPAVSRENPCHFTNFDIRTPWVFVISWHVPLQGGCAAEEQCRSLPDWIT